MVTVNLRKIAFTGWCLMMFSLVFVTAETIYFGSNWLPESKAELACDLFGMAICSCGCLMLGFSIIVQTKRNIEDILKNTK